MTVRMGMPHKRTIHIEQSDAAKPPTRQS